MINVWDLYFDKMQNFSNYFIHNNFKNVVKKQNQKAKRIE